MAQHKLLIFAMSVIMASAVQAKTSYNFKELSLKDYEEMQLLVQKTAGYNVIDDNEREPKVREALQIVLSKPNNDGKRTALFTHLQGQLPEAFFQLSLQKVAESSINTLKENSNTNVTRATAYLCLENLLAEIRPRSENHRSLLKLISDAKIEIPESLESYRKLEGMTNNISPSDIAKNFLDESVGENENSDSHPDIIKRKAFAKSSPDLFE